MHKYLYGASGHAKVIIDILKKNNAEVKAIFDDDPEKKELLNIPVIGAYSPGELGAGAQLLISVGHNATRQKISQLVREDFFTAIDPSAIISSFAKIGKGTVVMPGCIVNVDSLVGDHVILNTGSTIDHDCYVEDFVHVSPNATLCGGVRVGELSWIGAGAVVRQYLRIGRNVMIGAGAVVVSDIPDNAVVMGNPARIKSYNKEN